MVNTDITINGNIATWSLPPTIGDLGGTYTGTFTFRTFLSPLQQLQAGREYRELLGSLGSQASVNEINLSFALVQLKHTVISAPPFWTSTLQESGMQGNIGDLNVIFLVLDASARAEETFKDRILKEREEALDRSIKAAEALLQKQASEDV